MQNQDFKAEDAEFFFCSNCSHAYKTKTAFISHDCAQDDKTGKVSSKMVAGIND